MDLQTPTSSHLNMVSRPEDPGTFNNLAVQAEKSHFEGESPQGTLYLQPIMRKFIFNLKTSLESHRLRSMSEKAFSLLNDRAVIRLSPKKQGIHGIRSFFQRFLESLDYFQFIHPENNIKIMWDTFHLILIIGLFFLIPLDVAFEQTFEEKFKTIIIFFFILDIVATLDTAYYQKGFLMKDKYLIMQNYLKTECFSDVLTLIFYTIDLPKSSFANVLRLIFFLRWKKMNSINLKLAEKFKLEAFMNQSMIALLNLLLFCLFFIHVFACIWLGLGYLYVGEGSTWIVKGGLLDSTAIEQYFYALYWSAVTLMTVGYGDISATNLHEVMFSTLAVIMGCGVLAYIINSIGIIVADINKEKNNFKSDFEKIKKKYFRFKMSVINQYMERKKIDYNLQTKIREYLKFIWQEESMQNAEIEIDIINKLSKSLKKDLIFEAYGQLLRNTPLFFANFSEKFLLELMYEFKEVRYLPEDIIFKKNEFDDAEIYFLRKGTVVLSFNQENDSELNENALKVLKAGEMFGTTSFFSGKPRATDAKSIDFTTLFYIKRADFLKTLAQNPDDQEKYNMIKDQLLLYNYSSFLQSKCSSCGIVGHSPFNCPLVHFLPNKLKIIKAHIRDPGQKERKLFKRKTMHNMNFNSLSMLKYVQQTQKRFQKFKRIDDEEYNEKEEINIDENEDNIEKKPSNTETNLKLNKFKLKINTKFDRSDTIRNNEGGHLLRPEKNHLFQEQGEKQSSNENKDPNNGSNNVCSLGYLPEQSNEHFRVVPSFLEKDEKDNNDAINSESDSLPKLEIQEKASSNSSYHFLNPDLNVFDEKNSGPKETLENIGFLTHNQLSLKNETEKMENSLKNSKIFEKNNNKATNSVIIQKEDLGEEIGNDFFEFQNQFEKCCNFKYYYPDQNPKSVIASLKKFRKPGRGRRTRKIVFENFKGKKNWKFNRVVPFPEEVSPPNISPTLKKTITNIFKTDRTEKKSFFKARKIGFYDLVLEVLRNTELKKKLEKIKKKNSRKSQDFK